MEKESVKMFDLLAAFKALDEIETPKTEKGLKANRVDLKETFATKTYGDSLIEDYYSVTDHEALEEAQEDREAEINKAKLARIEKIVDLDAESPEDLEPSYVGKVIIQCPQCMTLFYKNPEDIEPSEENPEMVNVNEVCQHCGNDTGYMLIGKVGEVEPEEVEHFEGEENELDLDFGEPTEEVSPEGTGGGFEDELGSEGSEDELDLNLEEVELAPTEESLQVTETLNEAKEDSDSSDNDDKEVTVTIGEIKDVAEEAGEAVVKAEIEDKEEVKEVTDKVVEKEVEKEILTEAEAPQRKFVIIDWSRSLYGNEKKYEELKARMKHEYPNAVIMFYHPIKLEGSLKYANMGVPFIFITDRDVSGDTNGAQIIKHPNCEKVIRLDLGESLAKEKPVCPKCGKEICECDKQVVEEKCDNCEDKKLTEAPQTPDEIERILWSVADSFDESLAEAVEDPNDSKEVELDKAYQDAYAKWEELTKKVAELKIPMVAKKQSDGSDINEPDFSVIPEEKRAEAEQLYKEYVEAQKAQEAARNALDAHRKQRNESLTEAEVSNTEFKDMLNSEVWQDFSESLTEDIETVKANLSTYCDELEHAGEAMAKAMGAEEKEEEPTVKENLVEASIKPGEMPWWVHPLESKEVEEDFTGTPEERTTHLEYVDDDVTDEKVVLPNNITKKEDDHCEEVNLVINHTPDEKDVLKEEITDISEEYFDKHINDYLQEVYSNIKEYKSTSCELRDGTLFIEGTITFNSGKTKNTIFEFVSPTKDENGSIICEGYNKGLTEEKAFVVKGAIEGGNKFVTESLTYSYQINGTKIEGSN